MKLNLSKPICFFDLETTGINISKDRIVEISILKVFPSGKEEIHTWLVNPEMKIPDEVVAIHGISNEKIKDSPVFKDLAKEINKLRAENKQAFNGIILDMRNNPGGLLTQAVSVSAAFLGDDELVVYTEGRAPDSKMRLTTAPENFIRPGGDFEKNNYIKSLPQDIKDVPMVVIINNGSASAAEIVTGALKDHKRATILGTRSFGKGSVQSILPMMNGSAIKLTTARYFTPNGISIQGKGIEPDITVKDGTESLAYREEDIPDSLSNPQDKGKKEDKPLTNGPTPEQKEALKNFKPIKFGTDEDIQYVEALKILKGMGDQAAMSKN